MLKRGTARTASNACAIENNGLIKPPPKDCTYPSAKHVWIGAGLKKLCMLKQLNVTTRALVNSAN